MKYRSIIIGLSLLTASQLPAAAQEVADTLDTEPAFLPGEVRDTTARAAELRAKDRQLYYTEMNLLARAYGDSIVLRWAAPDYVAWRFINHVGVNLLRQKEGEVDIDTLAMALKPTPLERFRASYPESDSLAMMGMGSIYNLDRPSPYGQRDEAGSVGALFDIHGEQQMQYGVALLVAEWRPDVATHMAMRFVDRTAARGTRYTYFIVPAADDTTQTVLLSAAICPVENVRYTPTPLDIQLKDSIMPPTGVRLTWPRKNFSSYEVERRQGGGQWQRLNDHPYLIMFGDEQEDCFFDDRVEGPGMYEYRIMAHDAFGDLTAPTAPYAVRMRDLIPPHAPEITQIIIQRPREEALGEEVWADICFQADTLDDDCVGFLPVYRHERATQGEWRPLLDKPLATTDTLCHIDVTNLSTGDIAIAAYDTAQNVGYSIPQLLRVSDMRPPKAPTGLHAVTSATEGTITLVWDDIKDDDISYYEIIFANDSTHEFMVQERGQVTDTIFVDSVDMTANQKYIYYKVRAVDYATNQGPFTEMLQVVRPSNVPPSVAHLDSASVTGRGVYMRWIAGSDELMAYHHVLRRREDQQQWTILMKCNADSIKANRDFIELCDTPDVSTRYHWVYAIESFNYSDISSGLSLQYMTYFAGERVFEWPIRLYGDYHKNEKETRLAWEMNGLPPYAGEWYFCIYRQAPDDDRPQFLISAQPDERAFSDYLLQPGETARYYIIIQYADGRESSPSNIVEVSRGSE